MGHNFLAVTAVVAAAVVATALPGGSAAQVLDVPVMIGGEPDLDACSGVGRIARLNPRGDGFLAVRAGPSTDYAKIDELYNGDIVVICDQDGRWSGVVYGGADCGTSSPVPRRMAYRGPCRAGWVFDRYVDYIAG
ncbi:MAG: SH3 domain-containing protein [Pseudomonadota bacterium]